MELAAGARDQHLALVAGVVEASEGPGTRPTKCWLSDSTAAGWLASCQKIHIFDAGVGESEFIKRGESFGPVVFEHGGVRIGLMICYGLRFTELARSLPDAGAQVLRVCSS